MCRLYLTLNIEFICKTKLSATLNLFSLLTKVQRSMRQIILLSLQSIRILNCKENVHTKKEENRNNHKNSENNLHPLLRCLHQANCENSLYRYTRPLKWAHNRPHFFIAALLYFT